MNRKICAVALAVLTVCSLSLDARRKASPRTRENAAFLEQLQERDSILIGDQMRYGFRIYDIPDSSAIALPDWSEGFTEGVEVITPWLLDTTAVHGKAGSRDIEGFVVLTSFDEGLYELPPVALVLLSPGAGPDTLVFDTQWLSVWDMPVDTATFTPHDIKPHINYPVTFSELAPWIGGGLALAVAIYFLIRWIIALRRRKIEGEKKEPAHIVALRKLDKYRGDKLWEPEKQKLFFSGVTDTLREYIASRYGFGAMEMTTAEIFDALSDKDLTPELYSELKSLFEESDFVKFAKHIASRDAAAGAVPLAVRFVTTTYQEDLENEKEDTMQQQEAATL